MSDSQLEMYDSFSSDQAANPLLSEDEAIDFVLLRFYNEVIDNQGGDLLDMSVARQAIKNLLVEAREKTASEISAIFDTFEYDPTGTFLDEHMTRRTPGDINWARGTNSDHAWAAAKAKEKVEKYIEQLKSQLSEEITS